MRVLAWLLLSSVACAAPPTITITGATGAAPGSIYKLVAESADATHFAWRVKARPKAGKPPLPDTWKTHEVEGERGEVLRLSTPAGYVFGITVGASNADGLELAEYSVTIDPESPPEPDPGPNPGPHPEPEPEPDLPDGRFGISRDVREWTRDLPATERALVGGVFTGLAAQIAAGVLSTPAKISAALVEAMEVVPQARWTPFGRQLEEAIGGFQRADQLRSPDAWATLFREIALGLRTP